MAYTPGHASHHVQYFDAASGVAFVGDVAGGRLGTSTFVMTPTPPPDIDLAAWHASARHASCAWEPRTLFLTHFGPSLGAGRAPGGAVDRLPRVAAFAREAIARGDRRGEDGAYFRDEMRRELRRHMSEHDAPAYELAMPFDHCFFGLARYWRKRSA